MLCAYEFDLCNKLKLDDNLHATFPLLLQQSRSGLRGHFEILFNETGHVLIIFCILVQNASTARSKLTQMQYIIE